MAAGRASSDVMIEHVGKPRCALSGAVDKAVDRYHDGVLGTRSGSMRLRRLIPAWMVLALTAAGLLIGLALVDRDKPWLVLDTGLAMAAFAGAFAVLSVRRIHAQREVDRIFTAVARPDSDRRTGRILRASQPGPRASPRILGRRTSVAAGVRLHPPRRSRSEPGGGAVPSRGRSGGPVREPVRLQGRLVEVAGVDGDPGAVRRCLRGRTGRV